MEQDLLNNRISDIVDLWEKPIYKFCLCKLNGDKHRAEDCVQNVFYSLYSAKDKISDYENVHKWLYKTANNFVLKEFRNISKELKSISIEDSDDALDVSFEINFDDFISDHEISKIKEVLTNQLTKDEQKLLNLFYEKNLSIKEISKKLNITDSAVYKRKSLLEAKIKIMVYTTFNA